MVITGEKLQMLRFGCLDPADVGGTRAQARGRYHGQARAAMVTARSAAP